MFEAFYFLGFVFLFVASIIISFLIICNFINNLSEGFLGRYSPKLLRPASYLLPLPLWLRLLDFFNPDSTTYKGELSYFINTKVILVQSRNSWSFSYILYWFLPMWIPFLIVSFFKKFRGSFYNISPSYSLYCLNL